MYVPLIVSSTGTSLTHKPTPCINSYTDQYNDNDIEVFSNAKQYTTIVQ